MKELISGNILLRPLVDSDKNRLAELCNNKKIWDNLRDSIPFPYTVNDAVNFIKLCQKQDQNVTFAIEFKGELCGVIGLVKQTDIYKHSAEIGYWIGEPFWGKGIATAAVNLIVGYGFNDLNLVRIYTAVFDFNKASQKVLRKAGFILEGIFDKSVSKNGRIFDEYRYAKVNPAYD